MADLTFLAIIVLLIFLLVIIGIDVAFAIGSVGILWLIIGDYPLIVAPSRTIGSIDLFVLLAIPFFILAAEIMNQSKITPKLVRIGNMTTGRVKGGLAQANVVTSMLFAGLSGSAVADVAALGSIFIPSMRDEGYDGAFSTALTAATSVIGPIIPPSIILVIYGAITNTSIGALFAAAIVPGIILGLSIMVLVLVLSYKNDFPRYDEKVELHEYPRLIGTSAIVLTVPAIILIGIIGGFFTATEAAAVASAWAALIGAFVFNTLNIRGLYESFSNSIELTAQLYIIIALTGMFSWLLSQEGVPELVSNALLETGASPTTIMVIVGVILLLLGTWLDINAAIIILAPTLTQVAAELGIHELQFGLVMVLALTYGLITPPLGLCLFAASGVSGYSVTQISRRLGIFYLFHIAVLVLLIYIPELTLFLPEMFGYV